MSNFKKKKLRPMRDMAVPAMSLRGGKGVHKDHRKEANKHACRRSTFED